MELNPVRAAMVERPAEHRWSSYRVNAQGEPSTFISPYSSYETMSTDDTARRSAYRELFRTELNPVLADDIRTAAVGNYVLGTERFQKEAPAMLGRRVSRGPAGLPRKAIGG